MIPAEFSRVDFVQKYEKIAKIRGKMFTKAFFPEFESAVHNIYKSSITARYRDEFLKKNAKKFLPAVKR
jgi:hypothetical protein